MLDEEKSEASGILAGRNSAKTLEELQESGAITFHSVPNPEIRALLIEYQFLSQGKPGPH